MASLALLDTPSAVSELRAGNVIAYPTEAVYGLGCDPRNELAVRNILALKDRQEAAGFVLIASDIEQIKPWIAETPPELFEPALESWPGPVTWLFPRAYNVPDFVAGHHKTVAIRMTAHPASHFLCEAFGSAIISTSANHSSEEPARSVQEVENYFAGQIAGTLEGALGVGDKPSEIRDLMSGDIIRQG